MAWPVVLSACLISFLTSGVGGSTPDAVTALGLKLRLPVPVLGLTGDGGSAVPCELFSTVPVACVAPAGLLAFSKAPRSRSPRRLGDTGPWISKRRAPSTHRSPLNLGGRFGKLSTVAVTGAGILLPLAALLQRAQASPFDPHPLPFWIGLAFFNGWYVRVTDHENRCAFAVIIGSFKHKGARTYTEHYLALLYADHAGNFVTAHAFPDPDTVSISMGSDGYAGVPANFTWTAQDIGELKIEDGKGRLDFRLPGCSIAAAFKDRVAWDANRPNSAGPEGWLGKTALLPCRYYVHSLASRTSYRIRIGGQRTATPHLNAQQAEETGQQQHARQPSEGLITGRGFAHMESNYGNHFPSGWIWVQAVSRNRDVQLLLIGGKFDIGPVTPTTWVIAFRSPRFKWDFRTTDLDVVHSEVNYSARRVFLTATSRCGKRKLEVDISAAEDSFGSPIYVPTPNGFSNEPGCRESFTAKAKLKAVDLRSSKMRVCEEVVIDLAALEFGGDMQKL